MAREHPLLSESYRFSIDAEPIAAGWRYRRDVGAWVLDSAPDNLMVAQGPNPPRAAGPDRPRPPQDPNPPRPRPISKKADHETGEDMKGA